MKNIMRILLAASLCIVTFSFAQGTAALSDSLAPMLAKVTPAVVNIYVKKEFPFPAFLQDALPEGKMPKLEGDGVGTGVIINAKEGLIVTNAHVTSNSKLIIVTLKDGRRYRAKLIADDEDFDLAVLKINASNLTQITFGDSDALKVGDFVAAIGSPYGLTQTVTSGMVSALNRDEPKIGGFQGFIQTDASINPGNSGGALVNLQGQLVGINTAILTSTGGNQGIGFAIPSNMVDAVLQQLLKYGKVSRGMLGVMVEDLTPSLAKAFDVKPTPGVLVTEVVPGTPAASAGVMARDIILSVNGATARSADQLRNMVGLMRPGTNITMIVERNHNQKTLTATVGDPEKAEKPDNSVLAGMRLENIHQLQPDGSTLDGVYIVGESDESDALLAGLMKGDVMISANGKPTPSIDALEAAAKGQKNVLIEAARKSGRFYVVLGTDG